MPEPVSANHLTLIPLMMECIFGLLSNCEVVVLTWYLVSCFGANWVETLLSSPDENAVSYLMSLWDIGCVLVVA